MRAISRNLQFYVNKIVNGEPFAFSRYGDGEWLAILGETGQNCDGHRYFPDMGEELRQSLHSPYYHTVSPVARRVGERRIDDYLERVGLEDMEWHPGNVFVLASLAGELRPLVEAIRPLPMIYVGPTHLHDFMQREFPKTAYIEIHDKNAYLQRDATLDLILKFITRTRIEYKAIGFSAAMLTNCLIDALWLEHNNLTMIDFGSVFDPYAGVVNRSYMKGKDWQGLYRSNFESG